MYFVLLCKVSWHFSMVPFFTSFVLPLVMIQCYFVFSLIFDVSLFCFSFVSVFFFISFWFCFVLISFYFGLVLLTYSLRFIFENLSNFDWLSLLIYVCMTEGHILQKTDKLYFTLATRGGTCSNDNPAMYRVETEIVWNR